VDGVSGPALLAIPSCLGTAGTDAETGTEIGRDTVCVSAALTTLSGKSLESMKFSDNQRISQQDSLLTLFLYLYLPHGYQGLDPCRWTMVSADVNDEGQKITSPSKIG
jgi:hypothetical protein